MPWLSALVSLGTAVLGAKSAKKGQKKADALEAERQKKADVLEAQRLDLAKRADARAAEQYQRYQTVFQPLEDQLIRRLSRPVDTDAQAAMAGSDVQRAVATQQDSLGRVLRRRGLRAGDAAAVDAEARLGLGAARARAGAMTAARRQGVQDTTANQRTLAGLAQGQFSNADGMRRFADAGLSDVYGSAVNRLTNAQGRADQARSDNADAFGVLGDVVSKNLPNLEDGFRKWLGSATLGGG